MSNPDTQSNEEKEEAEYEQEQRSKQRITDWKYNYAERMGFWPEFDEVGRIKIPNA